MLQDTLGDDVTRARMGTLRHTHLRDVTGLDSLEAMTSSVNHLVIASETLI